MTPVFFVHGMWSTPAVFARLRARLALTGRPTFAPVLPYHDRAPDIVPPPELGTTSVEDYVAFLAAEIALLPEPPIIAGHSMGGFLAQAVAARVGAPGLILFSPAATASTNVPAITPVRTMMEVITKGKWWERPTKIDADHARWGIYNEVPAAVADAEIAALVWDSGRVLFEMALPFLARTGSTRIDHSRLTMPTLTITGDRDRITPSAIARATARRIAGPIDYHELAGASHWLWWGAVEERVGDIVEGWLETSFPSLRQDMTALSVGMPT
ncbi:MAG: alpha/beta hydrolase [Janthinobacterium lividum]